MEGERLMAGGSMRPGKAHDVAENKRRIVEMRDEGLGFREIASALHLDVSTVWHHYQRAMRAIPAGINLP